MEELYPSLRTARYPYIQIASAGEDTVSIAAHAVSLGFHLRRHDGWTFFEANADRVLNPGTAMYIAPIQVQVRRPMNSDASVMIDGISAGNWRKMFRYRFGCEDASMQEGSLTLDGSDILGMLRHG